MRNSKGFSLVEVLVAASVLAVILLAVAGLFSTAHSNVGDEGRRTKAVALAKQEMEELRDGIFPPSMAGSPGTIDGIYTRSWWVGPGMLAPAGPIPSIGVDTAITQAKLATLTDYIMPMGTVTYPPGTSISSGTIGTQANPEIVVVDGTGYTGNDPVLTLSATSGAGILIVKNGSLRITGNSQWVGLVIVIGNNVRSTCAGLATSRSTGPSCLQRI